jgi:hypothetical protein
MPPWNSPLALSGRRDWVEHLGDLLFGHREGHRQWTGMRQPSYCSGQLMAFGGVDVVLAHVDQPDERRDLLSLPLKDVGEQRKARTLGIAGVVRAGGGRRRCFRITESLIGRAS